MFLSFCHFVNTLMLLCVVFLSSSYKGRRILEWSGDTQKRKDFWWLVEHILSGVFSRCSESRLTTNGYYQRVNTNFSYGKVLVDLLSVSSKVIQFSHQKTCGKTKYSFSFVMHVIQNNTLMQSKTQVWYLSLTISWFCVEVISNKM